MSSKTVTLEKLYKKIGKLEEEIEELKLAVMPVEKISKKELKELKKTSKEMQKGHFFDGIKTFVASEKSLKKDWSYKGDDVWDEL